jgi:hypothetical protein
MADFLEKYQNHFNEFNERIHTLNYNNKDELKKYFNEFYNKRLNIIWGYYEILRRDGNNIISQYYTDEKDSKSLNDLRSNVYDFSYYKITTEDNGEHWSENFIKLNSEVLKTNVRDFQKKWNVPKSYNFLDYYENDKAINSDQRKDLTFEKGSDRIPNKIHDWFKNTDIQKELDKHPFYVVLNEEIYFFLLLDKYCNEKCLEKYLKSIQKTPYQYGLKQLLKFTCSVFLTGDTIPNTYYKLKEDLRVELNIYSEKEWRYKYKKSSYELYYRNKINEAYNFDVTKLGNLLSRISECFLKNAKNEFKNRIDIEKWNNSKLVSWMSRVHLEPYKTLLKQEKILPDFFVFPLFTNHKNIGLNELVTKNLPFDNDESVKLNRPVLFNCYVKSVFEIERNAGNTVFDETKETIFGFHITKTITQELAAPLVQSEFFGPLIGNLLLPQAMKSSLSSCMARNQSHNIGSHVLSRMVSADEVASNNIISDKSQFHPFSYLKDIQDTLSSGCWIEHFKINSDKDLEKYTKDKNLIIRWNNLADRKSFVDWLEKKDAKEIAEAQDKINKQGFFDNNGKNVEGLRINTLELLAKQELANERMAYFNSYMKSRQEFLSEVVSTEAHLFSSPDFENEVLKGFTDNRILLDKISGVEDFKYTIKLEKHFPELKDENNGVSVAMANDVMGNQAFYIILENLIRNTAKHSSKLNVADNINYVFTIRISTSRLDPSHYTVTVFDNISVPENTTIDLTDSELQKEEYQRSIVSNKINKLDKLILDQNILINRKILNDDLTLRQDALGLIEMEACAAYLRGIPIEDIKADDFELKFNQEEIDEVKRRIKCEPRSTEETFNTEEKLELRLLRAVNPYTIESLKNLNNNNETKERVNCLGYRFYIPKPKKLLIVDGTKNGDLLKLIFTKKTSENDRNIILQQSLHSGVLILSNSDNFNLPAGFKFDKNKVYPHSQMLYSGDLGNKTGPYLPKRILKFDELKQEHNKSLLERLDKVNGVNWLKYLNELLENRNFESLNLEVLRAIVSKKFENNFINEIGFGNILGFDEPNVGEVDANCYSFSFGNHSIKKFKQFSIEQINTHKEERVIELIKPNPKMNNMVLDEELTLKFLDSVKSNVVIIDERIQASGNQTQSNKGEIIVNRDIWKGTRVFIPSPDIVDLNQTNFTIEGTIEGIKKFIKPISEYEDNNKIDFLVIHLGVIEKCYELIKNEVGIVHGQYGFIKPTLEKLIGKEQDGQIVLTSGRIPRGLPKEYSFVNLSILSTYVNEAKLKINLNEVLNASRIKI